MGVLDEIQQQIQQAAEQVGNSVVGIGQRWGVGSGVVIDNGQVLTNAHNVRADEVDVTFPDGHTATGQVVGHDIDGDIAVIGVETGICQPLHGPRMVRRRSVLRSSRSQIRVGVGCEVTVGFVTGVERSFRGPRGRRITGSIEHDAPCCPGRPAARSSPADNCWA